MSITDDTAKVTAIASLATGTVDGAIAALIARSGVVGVAVGIFATAVIAITLRFFQSQPRDDDWAGLPEGAA